MSNDTTVMPILYNDEQWYVCGHGTHEGHEVVELVDKHTGQGVTLSGHVGDVFCEQLSDACLGSEPADVAEFMAQYSGLMHPVRYQ